MKIRVLLLGLSLALAAALLTRGAGPAIAPLPPAPSAHSSPLARVGSTPTPHWPVRDPFRYPEDEPPTPQPGAALSPAPASPLARELASPRLVGLVRQGERLSAALAIDGVVLIARPGDTLAAYQVLSVDEDAGVRLRGPAGEELLLAPAPYASPLGIEAR